MLKPSAILHELIELAEISKILGRRSKGFVDCSVAGSFLGHQFHYSAGRCCRMATI